MERRVEPPHSTKSSRRTTSRYATALLCLALATPALTSADEATPSPVKQVENTEFAVAEHSPDSRIQTRRTAQAPLRTPVVTRASVKRRLAEIDPADWLSRYGRVDRRAR